MDILKLKQPDTGLWTEWQATVMDGLPNYCADRLFVLQSCTNPAEVEHVLSIVKRNGELIDVDGSQRDAQYGAMLFDTKYGKVTRMWADSNVEYDFLQRHLNKFFLQNATVMDVGAGYGRLAVSMSPHVKQFIAVDSIPVSVACCKDYVATWARTDNIQILSVEDLYLMYKQNKVPKIELAMNIHSWNECSLETIEEWLQTLVKFNTDFLFTVSHGQLDARFERAYYSWSNGASYRPLIEKYFQLFVEESIGITKHPHALWRRRT